MKTSQAGPTSLLIDTSKGLCLNDTQEVTVIFLLTLLVQLVERRFPKPDVVGSSPTGRGLLEVLASGQTTYSQSAGIVQLVEHLLAKEDVARSSRVTRYDH